MPLKVLLNCSDRFTACTASSTLTMTMKLFSSGRERSCGMWEGGAYRRGMLSRIIFLNVGGSVGLIALSCVSRFTAWM